MRHLVTEDLHHVFRKFAADAQSTLTVFSPFIRVEALRAVLDRARARSIDVVTTWTTRSIIDGCSDLEVYPYLKDIGAKLFVLPGLHMKAIVSDWRHAIVSTANITGHGLGLLDPPNIECAVHVQELLREDQLWFARLMRQALLVQDDYYEAFAQCVAELMGSATGNDEADVRLCAGISQSMLLESLPLSPSPAFLINGIESLARGSSDMSAREREAVFHDCAVFGLRLDASAEENAAMLSVSFLSHPLVSAFRGSIEGRVYFGQAKAWLQSNCGDDPRPLRRGLTPYVRILFDWLSELDGKNLVLSRPHFSECLVRVPCERRPLPSVAFARG